MSDGGAQHIVFGPFFDSSGTILPNIKVYHYDAGTTNDADMWSDENKATTVAQPFVGDTSGIARLFGDKIYKIVIYDENDNLLYTWDNAQISRDSEGVLRNGTSFPGVNANNTWQLAAKKDGSGNFSELGISDGSAFIVLVKMNAGGTSYIGVNGELIVDESYILDEDDMASNSDTHIATQQSIKAFAESLISANIRDLARNLVVVNNNSNPAYQVDIDADEISTQNATGGFKLLSSVNLTADITASGANGLDTGGEGADSWYFIWAIAKADGTTAGLLSLSATAPTMPSGYTYKALLGAIKNSSGDFLNLYQYGNKFYYQTKQNVLTNGNQSSYTAVDLSSFIPSICKEVLILHTADQSNIADAAVDRSYLSIDGTNEFMSLEARGDIAAHNGSQVQMPSPGQQIYYRTNDTDLLTDIDVVGGFYNFN